MPRTAPWSLILFGMTLIATSFRYETWTSKMPKPKNRPGAFAYTSHSNDVYRRLSADTVSILFGVGCAVCGRRILRGRLQSAINGRRWMIIFAVGGLFCLAGILWGPLRGGESNENSGYSWQIGPDVAESERTLALWVYAIGTLWCAANAALLTAWIRRMPAATRGTSLEA
jgi:hypothetical protein